MQHIVNVIERHNYRTLGIFPVVLRLSRRFKSCSKANVSEGVEVFIGGGVLADGGVEADCCFGFAATDAGTKDIIVVEGFGAGTEGPLPAAFPDLTPGPEPFGLALAG